MYVTYIILHIGHKMDFIPLVTNEYKYAFCCATRSLPTDIQQIIWNDVLDRAKPVCPDAPRKRNPTLERLRLRSRGLAKKLVC